MTQTEYTVASPEIAFLGFQVTKDGIKPDSHTVQAVSHAERPQNKAKVKSFFCMIRSNGRFIPELAAAEASLRKTSKDINTFYQTEAHETEFQNLKKAFNQEVPLLNHGPNAPTFVIVNAHQTGLPAILTQGTSTDPTKAVTLASRNTTDADKYYSKLVLEATVSDFSLPQFRNILVGVHQLHLSPTSSLCCQLWTSKRKPPSRINHILLRQQDIKYGAVRRE